MPLSRTLNYNLYIFKIDLDFLSNSKDVYGYLKGTKYSEFPYMTLKQQQYSQLRKNTRKKKRRTLFDSAVINQYEIFQDPWNGRVLCKGKLVMGQEWEWRPMIRVAATESGQPSQNHAIPSVQLPRPNCGCKILFRKAALSKTEKLARSITKITWKIWKTNKMPIPDQSSMQNEMHGSWATVELWWTGRHNLNKWWI